MYKLKCDATGISFATYVRVGRLKFFTSAKERISFAEAVCVSKEEEL